MLYYSGITYRDVRLRNFGKSLMHLKRRLKDKKELKNYVVLVTCNRIEIYSDSYLKIRGLKQKKGREAIRHLFRVAAGADSMIIGENEIAVQARQAYEKARKEGHCHGDLAIAFERALKTAGRIRSKTKINHGKTSLASISVETVVRKYKPKNVLVIGSGMLAAKIAKALSRKQVNEVILSNRHFKRAKDLAEKIGGKADKLDNLGRLLETANVVFSATSCPVPVVYRKDVPAGKKIVFVDLAVPNDINNSVDKIQGVTVIRLKHFKKMIDRNKKEKMKEVRKAEKIIDNEVGRIAF